MRRLLCSAAVIVGVGWAGLAPAMATPLGLPGLNGPNINATEVEKVGYWRRMHRRYGYPGPYAYYPPAFGYYPPSAAYAYPPPVYGYQAPPPAVDRNYPSAGGDYGNYPSAEGDYGNYPPSEGGDYGDYPANGS